MNNLSNQNKRSIESEVADLKVRQVGEQYNINLIRNFAIVAHIDHGKTTLSDCLIRACQGVEERQMQSQFLDNLSVERERGITIKAQTICLKYQYNDQIYTLNLIDTLGTWILL